MSFHECDKCGCTVDDAGLRALCRAAGRVDWNCPIGDAVQPDAQPACPECEARESFQQMREAV